METKEIVKIDFSNYRKILLPGMIMGLELEKYIVLNYSTDKNKLSRVYKEAMKITLDHLIGQEHKDHVVQLFEIIAEDEFNTGFMKISDIMETIVIRAVGPVFKYVDVKELKDDELILEVVKGV